MWMIGNRIDLPGAAIEDDSQGLRMVIEFRTMEDRKTFIKYMKGYKTFASIKQAVLTLIMYLGGM